MNLSFVKELLTILPAVALLIGIPDVINMNLPAARSYLVPLYGAAALSPHYSESVFENISATWSSP